jgi:hypothetical protein
MALCPLFISEIIPFGRASQDRLGLLTSLFGGQSPITPNDDKTVEQPNDRAYGGLYGMAPALTVVPEFFERVEVLKGPSRLHVSSLPEFTHERSSRFPFGKPAGGVACQKR